MDDSKDGDERSVLRRIRMDDNFVQDLLLIPEAPPIRLDRELLVNGSKLRKGNDPGEEP
jgi:hypothetical protein